MALITITITESEKQLLYGIPTYLELETDIVSTIFYTFDGKDPTTSSSVYIDKVQLPKNGSSVTFKAFATNGTDSSEIIEKVYQILPLVNTRRPYSKVILDNVTTGPGFPYGQGSQGAARYEGTAGLTIDDPSIAGYPDGYDGFHGRSNETDMPLSEYDLLFSETDEAGRRGRGIGTLPGKVKVLLPVDANPPFTSNTEDKFFDPKALVIYQDSRKEPFDPDIVPINRAAYSSVNPETYSRGILFYTTALEGNPNTGTMLRQQYNEKDNTITYYYYDSRSNKWIISKSEFIPKKEGLFDYSRFVFGRGKAGAGVIYKWIPFMYRRLTV